MGLAALVGSLEVYPPVGVCDEVANLALLQNTMPTATRMLTQQMGMPSMPTRVARRTVVHSDAPFLSSPNSQNGPSIEQKRALRKNTPYPFSYPYVKSRSARSTKPSLPQTQESSKSPPERKCSPSRSSYSMVMRRRLSRRIQVCYRMHQLPVDWASPTSSSLGTRGTKFTSNCGVESFSLETLELLQLHVD